MGGKEFSSPLRVLVSTLTMVSERKIINRYVCMVSENVAKI